jgi:hypothetical protein
LPRIAVDIYNKTKYYIVGNQLRFSEGALK